MEYPDHHHHTFSVFGSSHQHDDLHRNLDEHLLHSHHYCSEQNNQDEFLFFERNEYHARDDRGDEGVMCERPSSQQEPSNNATAIFPNHIISRSVSPDPIKPSLSEAGENNDNNDENNEEDENCVDDPITKPIEKRRRKFSISSKSINNSNNKSQSNANNININSNTEISGDSGKKCFKNISRSRNSALNRSGRPTRSVTAVSHSPNHSCEDDDFVTSSNVPPRKNEVEGKSNNKNNAKAKTISKSYSRSLNINGEAEKSNEILISNNNIDKSNEKCSQHFHWIIKMIKNSCDLQTILTIFATVSSWRDKQLLSSNNISTGMITPFIVILQFLYFFRTCWNNPRFAKLREIFLLTLCFSTSSSQHHHHHHLLRNNAVSETIKIIVPNLVVLGVFIYGFLVLCHAFVFSRQEFSHQFQQPSLQQVQQKTMMITWNVTDDIREVVCSVLLSSSRSKNNNRGHFYYFSIPHDAQSYVGTYYFDQLMLSVLLRLQDLFCDVWNKIFYHENHHHHRRNQQQEQQNEKNVLGLPEIIKRVAGHLLQISFSIICYWIF